MLRMIIGGVLLALVHWLFYRRLIRATGVPGPAKVAAAIVLAVLWVTLVVALGAGSAYSPEPIRPIVWLGLTWAAVMFYLLLGLLVISVVLLIARLAKFSNRVLLLQVSSALLVAAAVGTVAYGVHEANTPQVVAVELRSPKLPAELDGLRVAVVADIHVGAARGAAFTERVVDLVNTQQPDVIVLPGDLIDGSVELVGPDIAPIADLRSKYGTFAVAGNHEGYVDGVAEWLDYWETLGVRTLRNQRTEIAINGATLELAGVYDYDAPDPYGPDLAAAVAGHRSDRFLMLMAHQPRQAPDAAARGIDLQVSGHTHGGQIWPLNYVVGWVNGTVAGLDRVDDMQLFTTRGVGAWGPPVRVAAPPDIAILTLRRGETG
ncbi:metallophosphoesterase [Nocardia goodfellowii]|uniref:MPP superfamily phosphohydrolase n=2 Tax=Nocardia goodfellowii TaxID=882446 RepID=A0ABS4QLK2_9NOCA|nr:putative MPP superfamily phosphohydrolase [Nocardia goodfellowii]